MGTNDELKKKVENLEKRVKKQEEINNPTNLTADDPLLAQAVELVKQYDFASASLIQRRLTTGYARAARILDQLETQGVIGPGEGAKWKKVWKNI
ncbi:MAG: hypothetical protein EPN88_10990 [Bacteroidetes bacterium]|nr:MAG: hypothetical protein EPN88_10990 [Bacteroidota bacterium]